MQFGAGICSPLVRGAAVPSGTDPCAKTSRGQLWHPGMACPVSLAQVTAQLGALIPIHLLSLWFIPQQNRNQQSTESAGSGSGTLVELEEEFVVTQTEIALIFFFFFFILKEAGGGLGVF